MTAQPSTTRNSVAIVGGGWAGLACALKLAQAGYSPVVFESASEPGGRARRALIGDKYRDNGQHIMLTGCTALKKLFELANVDLTTVPFAYQSGKRHLYIPAKTGKIGLAFALVRAKGFSWHERYRLLIALMQLQANGWCVPDGQRVTEWLALTKQPATLIHEFWIPLALAVLNTPPEIASMRRFVPILRDTLGLGGNALALIQPNGNLTEHIVTPLIKAIEQCGGVIHCGDRVTAIKSANDGYLLTIANRNSMMHVDRVVLAIPPWSLRHIALPATFNNAAALTHSFGDQPIATVYLGYNQNFRLPVPLMQIPGPTANDSRVWAIDRAHCGEPGVIAISISANGPWHELTSNELAEACHTALQVEISPTPECLWKKAVIVQRATYAATSDALLPLEHLEPIPRFHLAGDWTHPEYPATLEAAVASGFAAADRILQQ